MGGEKGGEKGDEKGVIERSITVDARGMALWLRVLLAALTVFVCWLIARLITFDLERTTASRAVGWSKSIVGGSATPVAARSRDDSSVAASESTPASMSGASAVSEAAVSSRTTRTTADSTWAWRCDGARSMKDGSIPMPAVCVASGAPDVVMFASRC